MNAPRRSYSRGSMAEKSGVNAETIRYYEKIGLMPDPPRSEGGHRVYDETHFQRLSFIHRCRELGFALDQIRGLLELVDGGEYTCGQVHARAAEHLDEVRERIADLKKMEAVLRKMMSECEQKNVPDCPIVDALFAAS